MDVDIYHCWTGGCPFHHVDLFSFAHGCRVIYVDEQGLGMNILPNM